MRVGKKPNVVEVKKTRSCVVRLEKVSKSTPNVSLEDNRYIKRTNRLSATTMVPTAKGRRTRVLSQDKVSVSATVKNKSVSCSTTVPSNFQTPQQQKGSSSNMSSIRSNQKVNIIPRSNKAIPTSTTSTEDAPPTIAAGRSRRAIKPNPKYASEDMVTSRVVRNVAILGSASRGGASSHNRARKESTSSDDFYNHDSEEDYVNDGNELDNNDDNDEDLFNDKAYQANERDEQDSDFSVIEEPVRINRLRGRPKRSQEPTQATTAQQIGNTLPKNAKRTSATISTNSSNLRSASSQLQQIKRSLASANVQRNLNLLVESSDTSQKRKLEEIQDFSDTESSYSTKHKQLLLSNSSGLKVKIPVREHKVPSTSIIRSRLSTQPQAHKIQQHQTLNGSNKVNNTQITSRRSIEISAKSNSEIVAKSLRKSTVANMDANSKLQSQYPITVQKLLSSKALRFRSGSPKLNVEKKRQNNGAKIPISTSCSNASFPLNIESKTSDKTKAQSTIKSKTVTSHNTQAIISDGVHEIKDDSPNSTMDDFETMPTFTIVNVNDIINKKGDVLITKAKSNINKTPTVIEFSESISLDDDDDDDNEIEEVEAVVSAAVRTTQNLSKKPPKLHTINNRKEFENKRSSELSNQAPQILNHKLGLRSSRVTAKTTTTLSASLTSTKPAPRILNSMVAKKTQPVKPMIANMGDSADESFPLSLDEDEDVEQETEDEMESRNKSLIKFTGKVRKSEYQNLIEVDTEDTESQSTKEDDAVVQTNNISASNMPAPKVVALTAKQNTQQGRRATGISNTPFIVSSNKKRLAPAAAKENSLRTRNQQVDNISTATIKQPTASSLPLRKLNTEKVVISKQGDKIIKKITCFETWYVINMPVEVKRTTIMKNQLEMPLIQLANLANHICLPNDMWSSKVTLYELSPQSLVKGTFVTYTGDLYEYNIREEDRGKYQPSCVMFRRSIEKNQVSRMPYDRAVIFKNKTFYTNIEGKNVRLVGAPSIINSESEIEILLEVVDSLTLQSEFVEHISIVQ